MKVDKSRSPLEDVDREGFCTPRMIRTNGFVPHPHPVVGALVWAFRRLKKSRNREMSARGYALRSVCSQLSFLFFSFRLSSVPLWMKVVIFRILSPSPLLTTVISMISWLLPGSQSHHQKKIILSLPLATELTIPKINLSMKWRCKYSHDGNGTVNFKYKWHGYEWQLNIKKTFFPGLSSENRCKFL